MTTVCVGNTLETL